MTPCINPNYSAQGKFTIVEGKIVEARLNSAGIEDLSPLAGLELTYMECGQNVIADLTPLRGMPLQTLVCHNNRIRSLSVLPGGCLCKPCSVRAIPLRTSPPWKACR